MTLPQIIVDLLTLLFDMAVPAAICTMVLAGIALRQEGGVNFQAGGRFQRWALWSVILLTLPQLLSWFAAQGIAMPAQGGGISSSWVASLQTSFSGFVSNVVVARLTPVLAAFCVLKAALDAAEGYSPLGSIVSAIFLLSASGTVQLFQSWNSGSQFATTDMLTAAWNFLAGTILPEAAGLAIVGAILQLRAPSAIHAAGWIGSCVLECFGHLEAGPGHGRLMRIGGDPVNLSNGLLNLTNWLGNVIMPTMAGLFAAAAIYRFSKAHPYQHLGYAALASLMCSGLLRVMESFSNQASWNNPDRYWISVLTLVNWVGNVLLPLYGAGQVVLAVVHFAGLLERMTIGEAWVRNLVAAMCCFGLSGLLRLGEFWIQHGTAGVR